MTNGKNNNSIHANWQSMLTAVPLPNVAAKVEIEDEKLVGISVKTQQRKLKSPADLFLRTPKERTVQLDELGSQVWRLCDGERSAEQIIDEFAKLYQLTFHESRAAVTQYLQELMRRGIVAMAMDADEDNH